MSETAHNTGYNFSCQKKYPLFHTQLFFLTRDNYQFDTLTNQPAENRIFQAKDRGGAKNRNEKQLSCNSTIEQRNIYKKSRRKRGLFEQKTVRKTRASSNNFTPHLCGFYSTLERLTSHTCLPPAPYLCGATLRLEKNSFSTSKTSLQHSFFPIFNPKNRQNPR